MPSADWRRRVGTPGIGHRLFEEHTADSLPSQQRPCSAILRRYAAGARIFLRVFVRTIDVAQPLFRSVVDRRPLRPRRIGMESSAISEKREVQSWDGEMFLSADV